MTIQEELEHARELRKQGRQNEALALAKRITDSEPSNADAWWVAGLAAHSLGDRSGALDSLQRLLHLAPSFASGWAQYGVVLAEDARNDEALKALAQAIRIDPQNAFAYRQAARICETQKNFDGQIRFLSALESIGEANSNDFNVLGIAHKRKRNFFAAIDYYRRSAIIDKDPAPYFNLALAYNDPEVSQDVDAVDSLNRALELQSDYQKALGLLAEISPRLQELAAKAMRCRDTLLPSEEWFQFYSNPFELLGASREHAITSYDAKTIQKLKRRLIQEIELEDGRIEHLNGFRLDKSHVIAQCEELNDDVIKRHHWLVFQNPFLLSFLTRGDVRHFLYATNYSPLALLDELDSEWSGFGEWLSKAFARQYNAVLSRALQMKALPVLESLFDGRRWVLRNHEEICFYGAHRHVQRLMEPLKQAAESAQHERPSLQKLDDLLTFGGLFAIMNLLPQPFRDEQAEAVRLVRDIAIASYNKHGDAELSQAILKLSRWFVFKGEFQQRLEKDFQQIEKLIAEEKQHEVKLTLGDKPMHITKEGVRMGDRFLPSQNIISIRWGILVTGGEYAPTYEFLMVFRDVDLKEVVFSWRSSQDLQKQEDHFSKLVQAAFNYIAPNILINVRTRLEAGEHIRVGKSVMRKDGVSFETQGWFSSKTHVVPWRCLGAKVADGVLTVFDKTNPKMRTAMALRESENAIILQFLAEERKEL